MQMSGEYGTELLIRYTEQERLRDLEHRRIAFERQAETPPNQRNGASLLGRLTALFGAHADRMPRQTAGVSQVHAAHR